MIKTDGSRCGLTAAKSKKADGYCYQHMGAQRRRTWGAIKKLRGGYHASYVGPDDQRHYAPTVFMAKVDAEVWLAKERRLIDLDEWTSPQAREDAARDAELRAKAAALTLREYADPWVQNRHNRNGQPLKARSQADYRRLLKAKIYPRFGDTELKDITKEDVLAWYRTMTRPRPNRHPLTPCCGRS
ncbi:tyrosine-type recombinase/integrase [Propioniciclava flava]